MWSITFLSPRVFTQAERDLIVEMVDEEARNVPRNLSFIVEEAFESPHFLEILIDGTKAALANIKSVIQANFSYDVRYKRV